MEGGRLRLIVPLLVLAGIAGGIWYLMQSNTGIHREAPPIDTMVAILPPPPPPPPPEQKPPEPEKRVDVPKPDEPKPVDMPHPMTINGPAQAGTDAFNIGAGDGSGTLGTGSLGEATYSQYMGRACEQALQQDDEVNRLVFSAEADVWADSNGRITRVQIVQSTGDPKIDSTVEHDCAISLAEAPPPSMRFPQRMRIRSARPS